jgi:hypothetical protein
LVLGLLISNANSSFIRLGGQVTALTAEILRLDQILRRARNKSSASDRSGFFGFIVHPPKVCEGRQNLFAQCGESRTAKLQAFPLRSVAFWQFQKRACDRVAKSSQSIARILTDDNVALLTRSGSRSTVRHGRRGNGSSVTSFAGLAIGANLRADLAATQCYVFRSQIYGTHDDERARRMAGAMRPCRVAERAHRLLFRGFTRVLCDWVAGMGFHSCNIRKE